MSILRYTASLDNTITNAFEENLTTRGTGSNMGASDVLETFSIYGQASSSSVELSRILIQFPTDQIVSDRSTKVLPASGSVTWKLKMYNAAHFETIPSSYALQVTAVSASWEEGLGLDMEEYSDLTEDDIGSNWINRAGDDISEITKFDFAAATETNYVSGDPVAKYIKLYNQSKLYNIYFSGSAAAASGSSGNWIKVDIGGVVGAANIATRFKNAISGSNNFDANIDGSDNTIVYVTASAGAATAHVSRVGLTDSELTVAVTTSGSNATEWDSIGGDYNTTIIKTQQFDSGLENLEIDVSDIVEKWLLDSDPWPNYGFGVRLTNAFEGYFSSSTGENTATEIHNLSGSQKSYYTKKFFGRGTEFFFKRPVLEAQFEDTKRDDRGNFHISSSLLPAADNLNTLFFYNRFRGRLVDIAGSTAARPVLKLYYSSGSVPEGSARGFLNQAGSAVTELIASRVDTGIYKVQIAATSSIVTDTYPYLVDVWCSGSEEVLTGSAITPKTYKPESYEESSNLVLSMTNLKPEYGRDDLAKLRLYAREKNWSPNIYTVAKSKPENKIISSGSYKVVRIADDTTVVDYGTGSLKYTELSYDQNGNYFEFNMDMLEPGYQYGFKFSVYDDYTKSYLEQPYLFKFRVV